MLPGAVTREDLLEQPHDLPLTGVTALRIPETPSLDIEGESILMSFSIRHNSRGLSLSSPAMSLDFCLEGDDSAFC